jgi:hypothetical protein
MTPAAVATYAFEQIDMARSQLQMSSGNADNQP